MAERRDGEKYPRSLQELLKITTKHTSSTEDGNSGAEVRSVFEEMSEERKQWLKEAIAHFSEDSFVKRMQECLKVLDSDDDNEAKQSAFDSLMKMVDIIDNANDLHKIGGFPIVVKYLNGNESELRWRAAELIGVLSQNNPYSQTNLYSLGVIPILIKLLNQDSVEQVQVKALYALSSITSNFPEGKKVFIDHDGLSSLITTLQGNNTKLCTKSSSMLRALISESALTDSTVLETLVKMGIAEQFIAALHRKHQLYHEYILDALVVLAGKCPQVVKQCQKTEFQLEKLLTDKIKQLEIEDKEAFEAEIEYSKILLELCFGK